MRESAVCPVDADRSRFRLKPDHCVALSVLGDIDAEAFVQRTFTSLPHFHRQIDIPPADSREGRLAVHQDIAVAYLCFAVFFKLPDRFLVKPVEAAEKLMPGARREIPYEGAKPMLLVDNVEDREFLKELLEAMYDRLPAPKKRKK